MTVLVIDDDPDILLIVQKALELDGMDVLTATTALEGIRRASDERPDGIVMDLTLPDLSGTTLLDRLQTGEATRDIPVVVTGFGLEDDAYHAPDESFRLVALDQGAAAAGELYQALSAL